MLSSDAVDVCSSNTDRQMVWQSNKLKDQRDSVTGGISSRDAVKQLAARC